MKTLLLLLLIVLPQSSELAEIRSKYPLAAESHESSRSFLELTSTISDSDSKTLLAYKGAALTLQAKYAKNISDKKKNFSEGAALVEKAVRSEPSNIEIRMIRLSIQENTPKIVNYRKNIAEDKAFILENLASKSGSIREYIGQYAQRSKSFTEADKALLR
ncbi:MAG: hypothetical protein ITG00_02245 [Flavobacterium sp.]|nr:hypothetical protein [Flavobacterium sp.]